LRSNCFVIGSQASDLSNSRRERAAKDFFIGFHAGFQFVPGWIPISDRLQLSCYFSDPIKPIVKKNKDRSHGCPRRLSVPGRLARPAPGIEDHPVRPPVSHARARPETVSVLQYGPAHLFFSWTLNRWLLVQYMRRRYSRWEEELTRKYTAPCLVQFGITWSALLLARRVL
jgi:hypothetical protein